MNVAVKLWIFPDETGRHSSFVAAGPADPAVPITEAYPGRCVESREGERKRHGKMPPCDMKKAQGENLRFQSGRHKLSNGLKLKKETFL